MNETSPEMDDVLNLNCENNINGSLSKEWRCCLMNPASSSHFFLQSYPESHF